MNLKPKPKPMQNVKQSKKHVLLVPFVLFPVPVLSALATSATPAYAQTAGSISTPLQQFNTGNTKVDGKTDTGSRHPRYLYNISVAPAIFSVGGQYNAAAGGTQSLFGGLAELGFGVVDYGKARKNSRFETEVPVRGIYSLGTWYWGKTGTDLYEVHGRYMSPSGLGVQVGYLNTSQGFIAKPSIISANIVKTDAEACDVFLIYSISSHKLRANRKVDEKTPIIPGTDRVNYVTRGIHNWAIEAGAGVFVDFSRHQVSPNVFSNNSTGNYTFFVGGALEISNQWWLQVSDWVLRDRGQDLNRVSLGISYKFAQPGHKRKPKSKNNENGAAL